MNLPKISIITPSYNQGEFIEETIRSVLSQNYPKLEYIVVDGGSTDVTVDILRKYDHSITSWISEPDTGQSDALNKGFSIATGDIIGWLNSDDTYLPGVLHKVARLFNDPDIDILMSEYYAFMNENGEVYEYKKNVYKDRTSLIRFWLTRGMTINQPCVFFRRKLIENMRPVIDVSLTYAMDYDLWLRLSRNAPFYIAPGHWANYRIHARGKSANNFSDFIPEWDMVSRRYWGKSYSLLWLSHCFSYLYWWKIVRSLSLLKRRLINFLRWF